MIKTKRIGFLIIAVLILACNVTAIDAQQVVVVKSAEIKPYNDAVEGFKKNCNCTIEELSVPETEHYSIVRKILKINPDAVLAIGIDALGYVRTIKDRPIVYTMVHTVPDDISSQENISGVSMDVSPERYLNAINRVFSHTKRIGLVYNPRKTEYFVKEAIETAGAKGIEIITKKSYTPSDVLSLIDNLRDKIDVFWMLPDTTVVNSETFNYMLLFSFQNKIPIFTFSRKYVEMGAIASLNIDPFDLGVQAGEIIKTLLYSEGVKSPIKVNARKATLTINNKMAIKLGIKIGSEALKKADVIE